jgi:voltage-gated potassium channel
MRPAKGSFQEKLHMVIYEADTKAGKFFDQALLAAIAGSLIVVMLDTVESVHQPYGDILYGLEWFFTILFTIEYIGRIIAVTQTRKYIFSFYGIVDLLSIIPTYISIFLPGSQYLMSVRALRLIRVFRVLKLTRYLGEAAELRKALRMSRPKITVFLVVVMTVTIINGTLMYLIEGPANGFTSIPKAIYWAIVTLTTVGYGDISPQTPLGQIIASLIMILGYGIIAIPTGIVTSEIAKMQHQIPTNTQACPTCSREGHADNAVYCKFCGEKL